MTAIAEFVGSGHGKRPLEWTQPRLTKLARASSDGNRTLLHAGRLSTVAVLIQPGRYFVGAAGRLTQYDRHALLYWGSRLMAYSSCGSCEILSVIDDLSALTVDFRLVINKSLPLSQISRSVAC
jgi:hypothetical protein